MNPRAAVFLALYSLVAAALLVIHVLPPATLERHAWAFAHLATLPRVALFAGLAITLLAAHGFTPADFGRLAERPRKRASFYVPAALLSAAAFWFLRDTNFELGDSALLIRTLTRDVHMKGFHLRFDEAMTLVLASITYRWLHELVGWDVARAYALLSVLAGAVAVPIIIAFCSLLTPVRADRLIAVGIFATSGFFALFFGHVENYTIVALLLILYLWVSLRSLRGLTGLFWPALVMSTGICFHALAGFFLPSLAWLWWERRGRGTDAVRAALAAAAGLAIPVALTLAVHASIGFGPDQLKNTHAAALKFIPLLNAEYPHFQYAFLAPSHVVAVANQLILTALPGLLAILAAACGWKSIARRALLDPLGRFLLLFAVCGQFFALSWNPDLGAYQDWDLFAVVGLGYAAVGAYLLVSPDGTAGPGSSMAVSAGLPIVVICGALTLAWVLHNATREIEVDDRHDVIHRATTAEAQSPQRSRLHQFLERGRLPRRGDARRPLHDRKPNPIGPASLAALRMWPGADQPRSGTIQGTDPNGG